MKRIIISIIILLLMAIPAYFVFTINGVKEFDIITEVENIISSTDTIKVKSKTIEEEVHKEIEDIKAQRDSIKKVPSNASSTNVEQTKIDMNIDAIKTYIEESKSIVELNKNKQKQLSNDIYWLGDSRTNSYILGIDEVYNYSRFNSNSNFYRITKGDLDVVDLDGDEKTIHFIGSGAFGISHFHTHNSPVNSSDGTKARNAKLSVMEFNKIVSSVKDSTFIIWLGINGGILDSKGTPYTWVEDSTKTLLSNDNRVLLLQVYPNYRELHGLGNFKSDSMLDKRIPTHVEVNRVFENIASRYDDVDYIKVWDRGGADNIEYYYPGLNLNDAVHFTGKNVRKSLLEILHTVGLDIKRK